MELKDKIAIVTGSGTGMGKDIAFTFARNGAAVAFVGKDRDMVEKTVAELRSLIPGVKAIALQADITKRQNAVSMVKGTLEAFGGLDILVNNAGIRIISSIADTSEEKWAQTIDTNLTGVFYCCQAAAPAMAQRGKGKIVNIAASFGLFGFPDRAAYCSSKGGVIALTRALAWELAPQHIYVNAVSPGFIITQQTQPYVNDPKMMNFIKKSTALERWGHGEEVAEAVMFLSGDRSDFITGAILPIDGGFTSGYKQQD